MENAANYLDISDAQFVSYLKLYCQFFDYLRGDWTF